MRAFALREWSLIRGVIDPIGPRNRFVIQWMRVLNAAQIYPALAGVRAPVMMSINPTDLAEMMLSCVRAKTVCCKAVSAFDDL